MKILLFGDDWGVEKAIEHLPKNLLCGVIAAANRPQYHGTIRAISKEVCKVLIQPLYSHKKYKIFVDEVAELKPDLIFINSYSMILREDILAIPRLGAVNIHGALLPKNRGPHPEQWALIKNEVETGVTLHEVTSIVDQGKIIDQQVIPICIEDTWVTLRKKFEFATDTIIQRNFHDIINGSWTSYIQDEKRATTNSRRYPADGLFKLSDPTIDIYNKIRALLPPMPPAYYVNEKKQRRFIKKFLTIWQVVALKQQNKFLNLYKNNIVLRPLPQKDAPYNNDFGIRTAASGDQNEIRENYHNDKIKNKIIFLIEELTHSSTIGTMEIKEIDLKKKRAELNIMLNSNYSWEDERTKEIIDLATEFLYIDIQLSEVYSNLDTLQSVKIDKFLNCGFKISTLHKTRKSAKVLARKMKCMA